MAKSALQSAILNMRLAAPIINRSYRYSNRDRRWGRANMRFTQYEELYAEYLRAISPKTIEYSCLD